jgi:hypothetical protein
LFHFSTTGNGSSGNCQFNASRIAARFKSYKLVDQNDAAMVQALAIEPVAAAVDADGFQYYSSGVLTVMFVRSFVRYLFIFYFFFEWFYRLLSRLSRSAISVLRTRGRILFCFRIEFSYCLSLSLQSHV